MLSARKRRAMQNRTSTAGMTRSPGEFSSARCSRSIRPVSTTCRSRARISRRAGRATGADIFPRMPRRIERKIRAEHARLMARFDALRAAGSEFPARLLARSRRQYRLYKRACGVSCAACDGLGSREAALDARYGEILESVAEKHGFSVESGEGDPCDIFLTCAVDAPENVEAE